MKRFLLVALFFAAAIVASAQDIRVTGLPAQVLPVEAGQYSGITYMGGDRYAVVDDKLKGGGIVFFRIPLRKDGSVRLKRVRRTLPVATLIAEIDGLDNEGVAYADGKLYVSAEGDQSIREYDAEGYPTGKSFPIPKDMGVDASVGNAGFEPLTYNEVTGQFWTTTELPLLKDTAPSRLHRLQRFDRAHRADARFSYKMDEPRVPEADAAAARAYVYGIPALAALDDGRLLVLEREVYVPAGEVREVLDNAFSLARLYIVNPSVDPSGILSKQLLWESESRVSVRLTGLDVALANYEGMCLGPRLPDGRRCLLLISDSQAGMPALAAKLGRKRVTDDFIKVLLLEQQ